MFLMQAYNFVSMLYLLTLNENTELFLYISNVIEFFFLLSGLSVITVKNPIVSILFLISLFLLVSIYLLLIGINFIGISYLLVYIGAVSILFLFILMLIDIRISELHVETMNNIILASLLGIFLLTPLSFIGSNRFITPNANNIYDELWDNKILQYKITDSNSIIENNISTKNSISNNTLYNITSGDSKSASQVFHTTWEGSIVENTDITVIGNILYTNISLWLILSLLILLLAMVGAIVINLDIKPKNIDS